VNQTIMVFDSDVVRDHRS